MNMMDDGKVGMGIRAEPCVEAVGGYRRQSPLV